MANQLYIPDLNPIKFVEVSPLQLPQYVSRHLEDFRFQDLQYKHDQYSRYFDKWQTSDAFPLQFESNFSPIQVSLMDKYDIARLSLTAVPVRENKWNPGLFVYEMSISFAAVPAGCYYLKLTAGSPAIVTMISEPIQILTTHQNTLLLEYWNSRYHGDVIFETGIKFNKRIEGRIGKLLPGRATTFYDDEKNNPTVLKSSPYRSFPLKIGGSRGVPDWIVDKFNLIWSCDNVYIDGKSFAASGDSKIEFTEIDRYSMRGLSMEVREGKNRGSKIIGGEVDANRNLMVAYNIESKMFGDISSQAASNIIPIIDIE
jgi:hypothetical protein